jgi:hypothetical protein
MGIIADFGDALARRLPQCVFDRELHRSIGRRGRRRSVEFQLKHLDDPRRRDVIEKIKDAIAA